jgi:PTS system nitrogen regulatory IIA component
VSEKTIYRWIAQKAMPSHRVNDQYRFNRAELLEWATAERIPLSPKMLEEPEDGIVPRLADALKAGGIHYRLGGADRASALRCVVDVMPLPEEVDRDFLYQVLLARESVGSTGIGDGIAIPHVRNPVVLHIPRPMVSLCFMDTPIDFGAIDDKPVHTLFAIVSPTIKAHLTLLGRLAWGLRDSAFAQAVRDRASREQIMATAQQLDDSLPQRGSAAGSPQSGGPSPTVARTGAGGSEVVVP